MIIFFYFFFAQSKKGFERIKSEDGDQTSTRQPKLYEKYYVDVMEQNEQKITKIAKYEFFSIPFMVTVFILSIIMICIVLILLLLHKNKKIQQKMKYE